MSPAPIRDLTGATDARATLARALALRPRTIPPRWLYDDRGSQLFDAITRLPEYYQTEAEREILAEHATRIAEVTGATTVIELGSGTSDKTSALLDAFVAHGEIDRFVPLDVSEATLLDAAAKLGERYPGLRVEPVVGDFNRHLNRLPTGGTRLVAFLGGTIGNFYQEERTAFLGCARRRARARRLAGARCRPRQAARSSDGGIRRLAGRSPTPSSATP